MLRRALAAGIAAVLVTAIPIEAGRGRPWRARRDAAVTYLQGRAGSISFAAINERGRMWGYRRNRVRPAVSVFKAMLLVTYLRMGTVRDRRLRSWEKDMLRPMIRRSDNYAASRCRDIVGHRRIRRLARDAGMRNFRVVRPWGLSEITARDQARFFFSMKRYLPRRHEDFARYQLAHIVPRQRWGMAHFVDRNLEDWRLFFKGGWGSGTGRYGHQVAFLEKRNRRIAVAILTEHSPSFRYAKQTLRGVARRLMGNLR